MNLDKTQQTEARQKLAEYLKAEGILKDGEDSRPYEIIYDICMAQIGVLQATEKFEELLIVDKEHWGHLAEEYKVKILNPR